LRGLLLIVADAGCLTIGVGGLIVTRQLNDARPASTPAPLPSAESANQVTPTPTTLAVASTPTAPWSATPTADPLAGSWAAEFIPVVSVNQPEFACLIHGVERVREHYGEQYAIGNFTIGWRPGAFPAQYADEIAVVAQAALEEANRLLGTEDHRPIELYLADQLYTPDECLGCQGYAAADLRQVFILQDGSLAADELRALLVHEFAHVIAAEAIFLPLDLFYAEGLATWAMTDAMLDAGYLSPLQTAAWVHAAGALPPLQEIREDDFAGRMRKRVAYDASASFAFFVIDTYGWPAYRRLYTLDPPSAVVGKDWQQLEAEWHAYLDQWAGNVINGVDGPAWWTAASQVIAGYARLYDDPSQVTAEQYASLVEARLALNRGDVALTQARLDASGLVVQTAQ
jgi:hypothetical protein